MKSVQDNKDIKLMLKNAGVTCDSCWWREGNRCYFGEPEREESGRSKVFAIEVCENHSNKRDVLSKAFGNIDLTIVSEENAKAAGKEPPNY